MSVVSAGISRYTKVDPVFCWLTSPILSKWHRSRYSTRSLSAVIPCDVAGMFCRYVRKLDGAYKYFREFQNLRPFVF
jgi:hypothetical protein